MVKTKQMRNLTKAFFLIMALMLAAGLALSFATPTHSQEASGPVFEIDGNAHDGNVTAPPDDWDTVFPPPFGPVSVFPLGEVFIIDGDCADCAAYTDPTSWVRGSADVEAVSAWQWTAHNNPAKSELTNAYAVAYSEGGNFTIFFGLDRCSVNGDTSVGFWFFQDEIGLIGNTSGTFSGQHQNGDILVVSEFQGSGVGDIFVYKWKPHQQVPSHTFYGRVDSF